MNSPSSWSSLLRLRCRHSLPSFTTTSRPTLRKYIPSIRRELGTTVSLSVAGTALVFLIIFLLGAESSLTLSLSQSPYAFYTRSQHFIFARRPLTPLENHLHSFHAIPLRYLRVLSPSHQRSLYTLLSKPSNNLLSPPVRHVIFAHVTSTRLQPSLRAMAAIIAYAQSTDRIALLFVEKPGHDFISTVLQTDPGGTIGQHAIVTDIHDYATPLLHSSTQFSDDWAEFKLAKAVLPTHLLVNHSTPSHAIIPMQDPVAHDYANLETLPKVGNTRHVATLDNLAVVDVHVTVTISEVIWSKYAPRATQEHILTNLFRPTPRFADSVQMAALVGRHKNSRDIRDVDQLLHKTFHVPRMLLTGMSPHARRLLLLKLQSKQRKGVTSPRAFFVHAQYGLGNRLRALGSAMAFSRRTDRVLVLIWVPDQHLDCRYTDLFVANDEFVVADIFLPGEEWPFDRNNKTDPEMKHVEWFNFMRINGVQANDPSQELIDEQGRHMYVSTCYVIQSTVTPFIIRTQSSFWQVLRTLTPHIHVARLIERFATYPMSTMIGVHIRGKSIKADIAGVTAEHYSAESSRRTDFWRNLTQVDTFIAEMRRQPPDTLFYVAADQTDALVRLENEFPSRVFYTPRNCDSRARECLPFALADILLLAQCSSLRGSYWSSFSELSVRIGGARFLLAGIDFGRPQQRSIP